MQTLYEVGKRAKAAEPFLNKMKTQEKNDALKAAADALLADVQSILLANKKDLELAKENGMSSALLDRLCLTEDRVKAMAEGLVQLTELEDPIGKVMQTFERPNGLKITQRRVPLGVIGIIYEARPNVTADAFGLCFKAGNAVILKGGSDAIHSNQAITASIRNALENQKIPADAIQLIEAADRETTKEFMRLNQYVDVLIPRGGAGLIRTVVENSTIPVIETGTGNCHIFIDESADLQMAADIVINAKTQRIGVCNACESLVVHENICEQFLPVLGNAFGKKQVEIRGDETVTKLIPDSVPAAETDWGTEYLDYIISIKTVPNLEEAIAHINRYNTKHSEAIITQNMEHAEKFLNEVDAAAVYVNASTRFTDGLEFGFGAEIGISTQKLHARGPMGLEALTSMKYQIVGSGQIR